MGVSWPKVKLGEVLTPVARGESVDASKEYRLLGIRLEGRGPFLRETILGSQSSATKLFRVQAGDFIYSRLFACRGAFGIIEPELDGCYVSGEFPTFLPKADKLDVRFLRYWFRLPSIIARVDEDCSGSTPLTRNRFKERFFVELEISLPPLAEQQRIVARIEALAGKIEEAKRLRQEAVEEGEAMCRSVLVSDHDAVPTKMGELVRMRTPDVTVRPDESYDFAGVYCFGKGLFRGQRRTGMQFSYPRLTRLNRGNFVYPKLMAWEGAFAVVDEACNGCVVSTEFPVFEPIENRILPEVLDTYFRTPSVWPEIAGVSTGTNIRRRRLNPKEFMEYRMPLPSMATQMRLRDVRTKVDSLKLLQAETAVELEALLPAVLDRAFKGELG